MLQVTECLSFLQLTFTLKVTRPLIEFLYLIKSIDVPKTVAGNVTIINKH